MNSLASHQRLMQALSTCYERTIVHETRILDQTRAWASAHTNSTPNDQINASEQAFNTLRKTIFNKL